MSYKIIVDSCGELTDEMKNTGRFEIASLGLEVDDYHIIDDETFDQAEFLRRVAASPNCPKSNCPSPERYMEGFHCEEENVYAVTLSAELSGSYNSAILGENLYREEYGDKNIHVFNSCTASVGQTLIAMKIMECEEAGMSFEETVKAVDAYIESQTTFFVLETLETLRKNGRLTGLKAIAATVLNIKPVMGSTPNGTICQLGQARGMKKALQQLVERVVAEVKDPENKVLGIAHCNAPERAENVKKMLMEKNNWKDIVIVNTRGVSTMYANEGGIIIAV